MRLHNAFALRSDVNRGAGRCTLGLVLGLMAMVAPARAQDAAVVQGLVLESATGNPIVGAEVLIEGTPLRATTSTTGAFRLDARAAGRYTIVALAQGFRSVEQAVDVRSDGLEGVRLQLDRLLFEVADLTVTASRGAARSGDAPVSVAVIGADELRRRDVVTLDEALPFAPGVIFNSGQMDIRGSTGLARGVGSRVLMLLDGHRYLSGVGSSIDFDGLPVLDVERVEIVKGPHSTLWGTNALGGVVNVITRRPAREPETIVRGYYGQFDTPSDLRFTDENLSLEGLSVQHSRRLGDVGASVFLAREDSDGFRQNGRLERWRVRTKATFPAESSNPWEIFFNWTREDEGEFFTWLSDERPLEVDPLELGDFIRTHDVVVGVTANPLVTSGARLQVRPHIYHARSENHFHDNTDFHRSTRLGTDVQLSLFSGRDHAVTVGAEAARTGVTSNFLMPDPTVTDFALFAQDEIRLSDRVRASAGVRLDVHDASAAERDVALNPKLGLVFKPSDQVSLRGSISRGYRAPSVSEQFTATTVFGFRVVPNLALRGESAWAGEIGASATLGDRVWFDAGLFWSEYTDLIEPSPAPDQVFTFQFQNVAEATVRGLDAGVRVGVLPEHLGLGLNYVYLDTEDARNGLSLPYRSRHNLTTSVTTWHDRIGIDFRHRSRVDEVLAFPLDDRGAITVVDVRVSGRLLGSDVQAKVENLFQARYVDVQERSPGQTRSFRLTVTPRF